MQAQDKILKLANIPQAAAAITYANNLQKILAAVPAAAEKMRTHNISENIITDTFADIGLWAAYCKKHHGQWGICKRANDWLKFHTDCKIFRIGRFQCIPRHFSARGNARFFRNNKTEQLLAITAGEAMYRKDGQLSGTSGIYEDGFRSFCHEKLQAIEGLVIDPKGHAINKTATLNLAEWTEVLKAGMPVLDLHIPADGDFGMETIRNSLTCMIDFTRTHQDAIEKLTGVKGPFAAFTLSSWLIDAQLDGILPGTSRLVQHLRQYYLLPILCEGYNQLSYIFEEQNIDTLRPEDIKTSLQRNIIKFVHDGGRTRESSGIIMFDDISKFGKEPYR